MLRTPAAYGFTEENIDALSDVTLLDKSFDGPGARYVFWDPIHPTTKAHGIVADWFHAARCTDESPSGPAAESLSTGTHLQPVAREPNLHAPAHHEPDRVG